MSCYDRRAVRKETVATFLLCTLLTSRADAELSAVSQNALLFVTSTEAGEEWKAYRVVRPRRPAVFRVDGPGRVLIAIRSFVEGENDEESIAAILEGQRVVSTARIRPLLDERAALADDGARRISQIALYLVQVGPGTTRVSVRHSSGADLLVAARFAPPLETVDGLVMPRPLDTNDAAPKAPARIADEPWEVEDEAPAPTVRQADPALESPTVDEPPIRAELPFPRALTVSAPRVAFDLRGGVLFSRYARVPAPVVGVDVRFAMPGLDARRWAFGLAIDVTHSSNDVIVRSNGAPVEIVSLDETAVFAGVDLRRVLFEVPDRFQTYAGLGAQGTIGRVAVRSRARQDRATLVGGVGSLRLGWTLGTEGARPFAEIRTLVGGVASDLLRDSRGAAGSATSFVAFTVSLGWRFELSADLAVE